MEMMDKSMALTVVMVSRVHTYLPAHQVVDVEGIQLSVGRSSLSNMVSLGFEFCL